jgi:diguanylate cyclase (GGDEF)-like protein
LVKKSRWGIGVFAIAPLFILITLLLNKYHPDVFLASRVVVYVGTVFSLLVFLSGHFSYTRVHNCKVYLLGYLSGLLGFSYFLLNITAIKSNLPPTPAGYFGSLLVVMLVNCIVLCIIPSYVKYRIARSITLAVFIIEFVLILVARFAPDATVWVSLIGFHSAKGLFFWFGPVCFGVLLLISILTLKEDFYLGGILSGISLISCVTWVTGINEFSPLPVQSALVAAVLLFTLTGTMIHWFSRMDHRVSYDPLLQIYNREYCSKIISEQSTLNSAPPFTLVMVDIDHFKNVNDTYGHQAGDEVLYTIAQTVSKGVIPQGIACRYGGEELAVFFPQQTSKNVVKIMENVRMDIEKTVTNSGNKKISVTISCGVAQREYNQQSIEEVLHAADKALYRAKKGGRNQVKSGKI